MTLTRYVSAGFCTVILLVTGGSVRTDDPVTSSVSFNREIIRIFDRKCLSCHGGDGLAMSLSTYREVRPWTRAIREEIVEGRMPPWPAAKGYARFDGDIGLTPRELSTILTWADGGMPRGDDRDLPQPAHAHDHRTPDPPDLTVSLPAQQVPGEWQEVVRRLTIDTGLDNDRWIDRVEVRPGDRRLLRAAFVSMIGEGSGPVWMGGWMPWQNVVPPATGAFRVRAGSRLQVELHYRGQAHASSDSTSVALFVAPEGRRELTSLAVEAAPGAKSASIASSGTALRRESLVWAVHPTSLAEGQTLEVTAHQPNGSVEVLLWIPAGRAQWPTAFVLESPVRLSPGTRIRVISTGRPPSDRAGAVLALQHAG